MARLTQPAASTTWLLEPARDLSLRLKADAVFRNLVIFTPPHREAIAVEPYTCITDAINLQARGVDAGLLVLPPGGSWQAALEWSWGDLAAYTPA